MKILQVIPTLETGGAEHLTLNLAHAMKKLGHDVGLCCVMSPPEKGALFEKARRFGIPCYYSYSKHEPRIRTTYNMARLFRRLSPDVVHSHLPRANSCTAIAARLAGVRCVVAAFHNPFIWKSKRQKKWGLWTARLQDGLFCDAEFIRERLLELCPRARGKTRVLYPAIPTHNISVSEEEKREFRKKWGIHEGDRIVGIIARLAEVKDHFTFIDAAEIVVRGRPDVKFLIVGDGPLKEEIKTRIKEKKLEKNVLMTGYLPSLDVVWSLLDIFVLTSLSEGFPVSILEAISTGIPVVATNVGGIPEIIKQGDNGYLFNSQEREKLAERILSILFDSSLHERLSKNASRTGENFQIDHMAKMALEFYEELSR